MAYDYKMIYKVFPSYFRRYRPPPPRDPYADPYRDRDPYYRDYPPYDAPPKKPQPPDVEIVLLNAALR